MEYGNILLERREAVALIRLNRPKVHNALNNALMNELSAACCGPVLPARIARKG